jgi:RNA polymerase sigma-70 factor (ECF subfamily)
MGATNHSPRLRLVPPDELEAAAKSGTSLSAGLAQPAEAQDADAPTQRAGRVAPELDDELVARVRRSEAQAFELLYRRHAEFAFNLAVRIQGSAVDVEDVVHDAFLKARERLEDLRDSAAFRPWLGSIVVRLVRTRLRRRKLLTALGLTAPEPVEIETLASADADPEARALLAQVYALLQTLSADDRIAWTLRYVERHRLETVSVMMDCSLATAKRRIARTQRFLNDHFVDPFSKSSP